MKNDILQKAIETIKNIQPNDLNDIYAFSFFVYDEGSPRKPAYHWIQKESKFLRIRLKKCKNRISLTYLIKN